MAKFIQNPIEVEAMRWTGTNTKELVDWLNDNLADTDVSEVNSLSEFAASKKLIVSTLYGPQSCWPNDWLVIDAEKFVMPYRDHHFRSRFADSPPAPVIC